ncbi:MAG: carbohydrate kinase family protein, partial [Candidatus Pacebacteria bacterium]|nr:carbohydrate kinase family protein [Candidatus Paceibacterota bacterium]
MSEIITFGSSTVDIFLKPEKDCFERGDKVQAGDWAMHSGGGGTNAACTFALQGFKTAYYGKVGDDYFGGVVLDDLKRSGVCLKLVKKDSSRPTALSVVLSQGAGDRVILAARGACHFFGQEDIRWSNVKNTSWFYIAPLYDKSSDLAGTLVKFAREHKIKVAFNPSGSYIRENPEELKHISADVDVLLLNLGEAALLAGLPQDDARPLAEKIKSWGAGIVVITMGEKGAVVLDGSGYYQAGIFPVEVRERTGAGDAFGSGFIAGL